MDVAVDGAGDDVLAGGVDLALATQVAADGGDLFAGDGDVGGKDGRGGDNGAVADDEIRAVGQGRSWCYCRPIGASCQVHGRDKRKDRCL
jgi:hypothetical protein